MKHIHINLICKWQFIYCLFYLLIMFIIVKFGKFIAPTRASDFMRERYLLSKKTKQKSKLL